jgi:hypothetical protein
MDNQDLAKLFISQRAEGQRTLRRWELNAAKQARRAAGRLANSEVWANKRLSCYELRMNTRITLRNVHLALAFVKGQDYITVEQSYRKGNDPDFGAVADETSFILGSCVAPDDIEEWVTGTTS